MRQPIISQATMTLLVAFIISCFQTVRADALEPSTLDLIKQSWAVAKYETDDESRLAQLDDVLLRIDETLSQSPNDASVLTWKGVVLSTYASVKGGTGALKVVDEARSTLEKAIEVDESAESGLAHTILGALYYRVPSWPLSFKDYKKAQAHLQKGLEMSPEGIDQNFFYGEYLAQRKSYKNAGQYFQAVLDAPARTGMDVADSGRRAEAVAALESISRKSANQQRRA